MNQTPTTYQYFPVNELFEALRNNNFEITIEQKMWVHYTLAKATEAGNYNRLGSLICPWVANSAQQQTLFYQIFDTVFKVENVNEQNDTPSAEQNKPTEKEETTRKTLKEKPSLIKRIKKWWDNKSLPQTEKTSHETEARKEREALAPKLIEEQLPDEIWAVGQKHIEISRTSQLRTAMQQMRRREFDELHELDIPATIKSTIHKSGIFSPVFTQRTRSTEYLILIDKEHPNSHSAAYAQQYALSLQKLDVPVSVFYFNGLPYYCYNSRYQQGLPLATVESRFSKAVLIVFSHDFTQIFDSKGAFLPLATVVKRWQRRILISATPKAEWDYRHVILNKLFPVVLPAGADAISALSVPYEQLSQSERAKPSHWKQSAGFWDSTVETDTNLPLQHILAQYPDNFMKRWIAACAVWPELRWQLSLQIGCWLAVPDAENYAITNFPTDNQIQQLLRTDWFRQGYIPKHQRSELKKHITPADKKQIEKKVIETFGRALQNTTARNTHDALFVVSLKEIARKLSPEKQKMLSQKLSSNTNKNKIVALQYILPHILDELDLSSLNSVFEQMLTMPTDEMEEWIDTFVSGGGFSERINTFVRKLPEGVFVNSVGYHQSERKVVIYFFDSYDEFKDTYPETHIKKQQYTTLQPQKAMLNLLVSVFFEYKEVESIKIDLHFGSYDYNIEVSRTELDVFFGLLKVENTDKRHYNKQDIEIITTKIIDSGILTSLGKITFTPPKTIFVKGGTFLMGSEEGYDNEKPIHKVTVSDFYMGKYQVTIKEYMEFVTETKSNYPEWLEEGNEYNIKIGIKDHYKKSVDDEQKPIVGVSWHNAVAYCQWLTAKTGKTYRLPTEAEWEYAAGWQNTGTGVETRRGASLRYAGTDNESELGDYAWYSENSYKNYGTHPVGTKKHNELGIYDMSGNVWEWCSDGYGSYGSGLQNNPQGPKTGSRRVLRGGSWRFNADICRVADRIISLMPAYRNGIIGFRLVCLF